MNDLEIQCGQIGLSSSPTTRMTGDFTQGDAETPGAIQPQLAALWKDLTQLIESVVDEMNRLDDLRSKTGGLEYRLANTKTIVVNKQSGPGMFITISLRRASIDVNCRSEVKDSIAGESEVSESLGIQIDESGSLFRNQRGKVLGIEQAVYYILSPFLQVRT